MLLPFPLDCRIYFHTSWDWLSRGPSSPSPGGWSRDPSVTGSDWTEIFCFYSILSNYIIKEKYKEILLYYSEKYPKKQELGIIKQNKEFSEVQ